MARPQKQATGQAGPEVSTQHTAQAQTELSVVSANDRLVAELQHELLADEPYDRDVVIAKARGFIREAVSHQFFLGRALLLLREKEKSGKWTWCIEQLGLNERTAFRYIAVARKFAGESQAKKLLAERLPFSKLLELTSESDESLEEFGRTGELQSLTLDDVDRMSTRELKDALREAKKDREQLEQQLERKDKKINELDRKASRLDKATFDEAVLEMLDELAALVNRADDTLTTLYGGAARVKEYFKENGSRMDDETRARMNVIHGFVESHLKKLAKAIPSA